MHGQVKPGRKDAAPHAMQIAWRCVERAKSLLGDGWAHVSDDVRWGLVCAEVLGVVVGQHALVDESATVDQLAHVARYAHELWSHAHDIREDGWKRPWGSQ
jgi:hypothetical protein